MACLNIPADALCAYVWPVNVANEDREKIRYPIALVNRRMLVGRIQGLIGCRHFVGVFFEGSLSLLSFHLKQSTIQ